MAQNKSLGVCVLLSCMHQKDDSIVERTNIQTDVVVINQCDEERIIERVLVNKKGRACNVLFICTKERGLSRSRNMGIRYATQPICLLCDDDEVLDDNYEEKILRAYSEHIDEACILFMVERKDCEIPKKYPATPRKVGLIQILQSSSVQITFCPEIIVHNNIMFDTQLGSGTGNGGGEENKFLLDIRREHLSIYYVPVNIGAVLTGNSMWFTGYTTQYLINLGWSSRRSLGSVLGLAYILLFWVRHYDVISKEQPALKGVSFLFKGYFETRAEK